MFVSPTSLPHLLPPEFYGAKSQHDAEQQQLCRRGWHLVATLAKVVAWYDNEWGYSCRVADLADFIADKGF